MRAFPLALAALLVAIPGAHAANTSGPFALALAGLVAPHQPSLSAAKRNQVAALFAGNEAVPYPAGQSIVVSATSVVCRVSDVDITARSCQLAFPGHNVSLTGAAANALYATLATAGVPSDGAAGSIYEAVHALSCKLTPSEVKQNGGGGADCSFTVGP
jgi:hypothetical protein